MLTDLKSQPADLILETTIKLRADPREDKIDLGVGVYKDASGNTPIMRAIKAAEKQLWEVETTKKYTSQTGEPAYAEVMVNLVLGDAVSRERVAAAATPGGTGAIRQAVELIKMASPDATIWISNPTWPNHPTIIKYVGMKMEQYRYFDDETRGVDFDGMMADLANIKAGDVVLLHGCCHNPTGANLNATQWGEVIGLMQKIGAVPFIDIAYQGFGDGLDADAAAVRQVASKMPETIIAASCSKNFGIYRERTGILMTVSQTTDNQPLAQATLAFLNRQNYSFPPDHGARLVTMILQDNVLRDDWMKELEAVRLGMLALRENLAGELQRLSGSDRFGFLAQHRGMFSRLGATPQQVETLRADYAIYMIGDSRINIAGLNEASIPILAKAIIDVGV